MLLAHDQAQEVSTKAKFMNDFSVGLVNVIESDVQNTMDSVACMFATLFSTTGEATSAELARRDDGSLDVRWRGPDGEPRGFVLASEERKGGDRLSVPR